MGKHTDELKTFEEFRAPWETEGGTDAEIDKSRLKRWIFNLLSDKAKAQDAREEAAEKVTSLESDLEQAKTEAASANGDEAQRKIDRLEKQLTEAKEKAAKLEADKELSDLRAEVLGNLDPKYAKYVKGETREELEKSLEEIKADFGLDDEGGDDEDEPEDEGLVVRTTPRARLKNVADPKNGKPGEAEIDFDKVAGEIVGSGIFG